MFATNVLELADQHFLPWNGGLSLPATSGRAIGSHDENAGTELEFGFLHGVLQTLNPKLVAFEVACQTHCSRHAQHPDMCIHCVHGKHSLSL